MSFAREGFAFDDLRVVWVEFEMIWLKTVPPCCPRPASRRASSWRDAYRRGKSRKWRPTLKRLRPFQVFDGMAKDFCEAFAVAMRESGADCTHLALPARIYKHLFGKPLNANHVREALGHVGLGALRRGEGSGLPLLHKPHASPPPKSGTKGERAYELRLTSVAWDVVAEAIGSSPSSANNLARRYAESRSLKWPIKFHPFDRMSSGEKSLAIRAYAFARDKALPRTRWSEALDHLLAEGVEVPADMTSARLRQMVEHYADAMDKEWPLPPPPWYKSQPQQAYELRASGASWGEVVAEVGYARKEGAIEGARSWSESQNLPWPIPEPGHNNNTVRVQDMLESLVLEARASGMSTTQLAVELLNMDEVTEAA